MDNTESKLLWGFHLFPPSQTGEMGLTQSVGEEGVKFEVWVRQARTKDCITLQAKDKEERVAWTHDIAHLLWTHAINNTGTVWPLTPDASNF